MGVKGSLGGNVIEYGHNEDIQRWDLDAKVVADENGVENYSNFLNKITNFHAQILYILSWKFWHFFSTFYDATDSVSRTRQRKYGKLSELLDGNLIGDANFYVTRIAAVITYFWLLIHINYCVIKNANSQNRQ